MSLSELCKAGGPTGKNYNKPHVWVMGMYDGMPRESCRFCGKWAEIDLFRSKK